MSPARPDILCIGAVLWDVIGRTPAPMPYGADVPGRILHVPGGVALNVAATLARLGMRPAVLSSVGQDLQGAALIEAVQALSVGTEWLHRDPRLPTDCYMAVEDGRGLVAAIADAHSLEAAGTAVLAALRDGRLGTPDQPWTGPIVLDGNLTAGLLGKIARDAAFAAADLRVVPASPGKAERLRPLLSAPGATFYLNRAEAAILTGTEPADAAEAARAVIAAGARHVLVTDGPGPVAEAVSDGPVLTAEPPRIQVRRVTGAGDCFLATHIVAGRQGAPRQQALNRATEAAAAHVSGKDLA
ncbi:PfkB family carbohydrate kinase [Paracoccus pacificus]|uniref:PfkB family carbohydrate kinase n=1 Tax=Paracoccus pacificus TaxID=1463598 RepID=A0ABW4R9A1_9RHOB